MLLPARNTVFGISLPLELHTKDIIDFYSIALFVISRSLISPPAGSVLSYPVAEQKSRGVKDSQRLSPFCSLVKHLTYLYSEAHEGRVDKRIRIAGDDSVTLILTK